MQCWSDHSFRNVQRHLRKTSQVNLKNSKAIVLSYISTLPFTLSLFFQVVVSPRQSFNCKARFLIVATTVFNSAALNYLLIGFTEQMPLYQPQLGLRVWRFG